MEEQWESRRAMAPAAIAIPASNSVKPRAWLPAQFPSPDSTTKLDECFLQLAKRLVRRPHAALQKPQVEASHHLPRRSSRETDRSSPDLLIVLLRGVVLRLSPRPPSKLSFDCH